MSKKIKYKEGATRRVILVGNFAVKFARPGITYFLRNIFRGAHDPNWVQERISERNKSGILITLLLHAIKIFGQGLQANRQEHFLCKVHPELPLAKVQMMLLGGVVLVMQRGDEVCEKESLKLRRSYRSSIPSGGDLDKAHHVCRVNGRLVYVDYGHPDAGIVLGQTKSNNCYAGLTA